MSPGICLAHFSYRSHLASTTLFIGDSHVAAFRENFGKAQDELRKFAIEVGAIAIDPFEVLRPNGTCPAFDAAGKPLYQDNNHLGASYAGSSATYIDETLLPTARK